MRPSEGMYALGCGWLGHTCMEVKAFQGKIDRVKLYAGATNAGVSILVPAEK